MSRDRPLEYIEEYTGDMWNETEGFSIKDKFKIAIYRRFLVLPRKQNAEKFVKNEHDRKVSTMESQPVETEISALGNQTVDNEEIKMVFHKQAKTDMYKEFMTKKVSIAEELKPESPHRIG